MVLSCRACPPCIAIDTADMITRLSVFGTKHMKTAWIRYEDDMKTTSSSDSTPSRVTVDLSFPKNWHHLLPDHGILMALPLDGSVKTTAVNAVLCDSHVLVILLFITISAALNHALAPKRPLGNFGDLSVSEIASLSPGAN